MLNKPATNSSIYIQREPAELQSDIRETRCPVKGPINDMTSWLRWIQLELKEARRSLAKIKSSIEISFRNVNSD